MPSQSHELFLLKSTTPTGSAFYGQAAAHGSAEVDASFRRGIDLSAEFDFRAHVQGLLGGELAAAAFSAGLGLRGGLAFEAAFPIDLFTEAGMVTRFQAQLAAVAYVNARLTLELEEFHQMVHDRVPAGPMDRLLDIFFDEVVVEAGLWARATFAAEVLGEATLTGSLLPSARGGPGFTYSLQYGAGLGYGTGFEFRTNFGIEDPHRLLDRMSATTTELILVEVDRFVGRLSPDQARATRKAVGVLRTLLPLAMRSAFQLGIDLASTDSAGQRSVAAASMVKSVVREAQEQLLRAAVDIALGELGRLLGAPTTTQAFLKLAPAQLYRVIVDFDTLGKQFERLASVHVTEVDRWLTALVACLPPLEDLLAIGALPPAMTDECRKALARFWSAATLVNRVLSWVDDPARGAGELFGVTPVDVPANSTLAAYVASRIGKPAGSVLTFADLVRFVLAWDLEAQLRTASPEVADALSWLGSVLGSQAGGLARRLLVELVDPAPEEVQRLLRTMSEAFSVAIDEEVVPRLLDPMKAADRDNVPLRLFIDELVTPTLVALPLVVLPRIAELGTEEMEVRFREALSAVVLQSMQRFVLSSVDVLLEHALNEGEDVLRYTAQEIGNVGEDHEFFSAIVTGASGLILPFSITPADAKGLLDLSADVIEMWNDNQRQPLLDATGTLLALGLATEDTRNATFDRLLGTDDPPSRDDLFAALKRTTDGLWEIVTYAMPKLFELILLHPWHVLRVYLKALVEGVTWVVNKAKEAIQGLVRMGAELGAEVRKLGEKIVEYGRLIIIRIAEFAANLGMLVLQATNAIRGAGNDLILWLVPDWAPDWMERGILKIYNALFNVIDWIVSGPSNILSELAKWIEEVLKARSGMVANDEQAIHDEVRQKIMSKGAPNLHFELKLKVWGKTVLDLGRVTLPADRILGAVANTVFGDDDYKDTVTKTSGWAMERMAAQAQQQITQQAYEGTLNQQQAMLASGALVPGRPLSVRLTSPAGSSTHIGQAALNMRIEGANKTFVQPTLGVPRRVLLIVNGVEYDYDAAHWTSDSNGISYAASIVPGSSPPAAVPTPEETVLETHNRTTATGITATVSADGESVRFAAESPNGPQQLSVVDASELFGEPTWASASAADQSAADQSVAAAPVGGATAPVLAVGSVTVSEQTTQQRSESDVIIFEPTIPGGPLPLPTKPPPPVPIGPTSQPVLPGRPGLNVLQVAVADGEQFTASESVVFFLEAGVFRTGFENGEVQPTWNDSFNHPPQNVSGYSASINPQCSTRVNEVAHSGNVALMYSGTAGGAVPCYCYFQVFDVTIAITRSTRLAYWIYPQQDNGRYVAVDFICTDGTTLRDSGSVDQNGASMHPNAGHGAIRPNEWSQIVCNVGQKLAGKTIDKILVAFDRPGGKGQFRGYIDDITFTN